jgi:hypothetical protein
VVQVAGFTVTLDLDGTGGTVTFLAAPAAGTEIIIASKPSFEQAIEFENAGAFLPRSHDDGLDRAAVRDIYIHDMAGRAFRAPMGEDALDELPAAASRASKLAGFDVDGQPAALSAADVVAFAVPGSVPRCATRAELAASVSPAAGHARVLSESGREGIFTFVAANLAAHVAADPLQGVYVAPSVATGLPVNGSGGAWVRQHGGTLTLEMFGGAGDCTAQGVGTDNYGALVAARNLIAVFLSGVGKIQLQYKRYRLSQRVAFTNMITIDGMGFNENPGRVSGTVYDAFTVYAGSIFVCDVDAAGFIFYSFTDNNNAAAAYASLIALGVASPEYKYKGANGSRLSNFMMFGGGADYTKNGIEQRCVMHMDNVRIFQFPGTNLMIDADTGGNGATTPYGVADLSTYRYVHSRQAGKHACWVRGNDANVLSFRGCDFSLASGAGLLDESQLGIFPFACHFSVNNQSWTAGAPSAKRTQLLLEVPELADQYTGSLIMKGAASISRARDCYSEGGVGQKAVVLNNNSIDGGNISNDSVTDASTGRAESAGTVFRGYSKYINYVTPATKVGFNIGDFAGKTMFTLGSLAENGDGLYRSFRLTFDGQLGDKVYALEGYGSGLTTPLGWSSNLSAFATRGPGTVVAPIFWNGFFMNGPGLGGNVCYFGHGTAMPAAGAYVQGDVIHNRAGGAGSVIRWRRLTTGAAHVLGVDWEAHYALTVAPTAVGLAVLGGQLYSVQNKIAGYNATETAGDIVVKCDLAAGFTVNLPTAVGNLARFTFKKIQAAGSIIIDAAGAETIDGALTATLASQYESVTLVSDGANWMII